jgi:hypothetical protein
MLNRREKRKIKELAERARSTYEIRDSMKATADEALQEIQDMLALFDKTIKGTSDVTALAVPSLDLELRDQIGQILNDILSGKSGSGQEFRNSAKGANPNNGESSGDNESTKSEMDEIPEWAKKLKKRIAKLCHPDAIARSNLSALEQFRRSEWYDVSNRAYEAHDWNELLLVGVYLDLYPEELPAKNQKMRISRCFQKVSSEVNDIRKSIAYKWSEHWNDYELKWTILEFYMSRNGMPIPDKVEAVKKIREYENSLS